MKYILAILFLAQTAFAGGLKWERTTKRIEARQEDRVVKTEFTYRNTGKTQVRIESVRGVCVCCTAAYATKKKLAPGESGSVAVRSWCAWTLKRSRCRS